jgi:hypothetical protein
MPCLHFLSSYARRLAAAASAIAGVRLKSRDQTAYDLIEATSKLENDFP